MTTKTTHMLVATLLCSAGLVLTPAHQVKAQLPPDADLTTINQFIDVMDGYLDVTDKWMKLVEDEDSVIYLVAEGVAEVYEAKGDAVGAIPELEKMVEKYKSRPRVTTAIRFKLRDLYKESGQYDKALKELHAILASRTP